MDHIFFIHSSVDGHLGCFYILAILNHAAVNTGICVSYKILIKEMTGDINRWRDMPCSCIGRLSLVKMTVLSKAIQIQCNPYQDTNSVFHKIRTKNFAICMDAQKTQIAKAILRKKNGAGGIRVPDFRLYSKAGVINTVWCSHIEKEIQLSGTRSEDQR